MHFARKDNDDLASSSFFGVSDNITAGCSGILPLAATFIPHVSYFCWLIPLFMAVFERRSGFSKLCAIQSFFSSAVMTVFSLIFLIGEKGVTDLKSVPFYIVAFGMMCSIIRVVCAALLLIIGLNGYKKKTTEIPILTELAEKFIRNN